MKNSTGTTLVELLISLTLGTLIVSCLTTIYLAVEKYYTSQTALINLNENMRIAEQYFSTVFRSASYQGCLKSKKIHITPYIDAEMKAGTDAFTIDYGDTLNADLVVDMQDKITLYATLDDSFSKNDTVLVSDCDSVDKAVIANVYKESNRLKIMLVQPLSKSYKKYAEISKFKHESYFIAETDRLDKNQKHIDALYMKNANSKKLEIMEGVADMKILYSTIENGRMVECDALQQGNSDLVGIMLSLQHSSVIDPQLFQQQYIYVAF